MTNPSAVAATVVAHDIGPFGGMESQLARLIAEMLGQGVSVTAIGSRVDIPSHPGLTVVTARVPARPFPLKYAAFFALGTFAVARNRQGPVYTIGAITFNRASARKVPFCHVAWAAGEHSKSRASKDSLFFRINSAVSGAMSRTAERLLYRRRFTGSLVAMSGGDVADLERFFPAMAPVSLIPNGVDTDRFRPDPDASEGLRRELGIDRSRLLAAFVGGDWERKGLPQVISALGRAADWDLIIAGNGDVERFQQLAAATGVSERVHFLGRVADPERVHAAADALAMPSVYEPWGNAVLEACACAVPVVVADASGVRDFVEHGRDGLVVEPTAEAVADALLMLSDNELRERMGADARRTAERYRYGDVAEQYIELFTALEVRPAADSTLASV